MNITRKQATWLGTTSVAVLGVLASYFSGVFKVLNFTSASILLPLGGLLIVLFIGWYFGTKRTKDEITNQGTLKVRFFPIYMMLVKFIAPIAIAAVFLYGLGVF